MRNTIRSWPTIIFRAENTGKWSFGLNVQRGEHWLKSIMITNNLRNEKHEYGILYSIHPITLKPHTSHSSPCPLGKHLTLSKLLVAGLEAPYALHSLLSPMLDFWASRPYRPLDPLRGVFHKSTTPSRAPLREHGTPLSIAESKT